MFVDPHVRLKVHEESSVGGRLAPLPADPDALRASAVVHGSGLADAVAKPDASPLFRVFLKDGTSLVSYGELARVGDRVVFSMPTSASTENPQLHLVDIPSDRVDWARTINYAESARASRYVGDARRDGLHGAHD